MTDDEVSTLRQDTRDLFYHGYINYLAHAFPEDELKPISCKPQTRNRANPLDIGLNDVLGNYSVTLVDSLSTLAILASDQDRQRDGHDALVDFKRGVQALVELYGDGRNGSCGSRACGFDLDSKVQVFETNIRGVGGLLSAHLFAIGELPIRGYEPAWTVTDNGEDGIEWKDGFVYDGQLLRLAHDLARRLLPAFSTATDLPYPRVNLRYGIPFYQDAEDGVCRLDGTSTDPREITETCTAGAGSLVLEFTTLSRLTGDHRFESLAKKAFWAVWNRRSGIGLVGGGIDAESGQWTVPPLAGIGAGVDSFFEYAFKSHILLSSLPASPEDVQLGGPNDFLSTWQAAHATIKRHVHRSNLTEKHPYYSQADLITGAPRYSWVDNLSAYYPGLLTLAGEVEEAVESHLLYAALWTRYSALPERWHAFNAFIDANFKHWAGRPEFIESTYYLYQATKDPYYLHVGEMALRDIRRRCWTKCGWADLGDVVSGEQRDRMESFFLGETAKYLYLLFDDDHPLNTMDDAVVFTTEGHPLLIPKALRTRPAANRSRKPQKSASTPQLAATAPKCPAPAPPLPLTVSHVANRHDLFHAASLAQLHLVPMNPARESALIEASPTSPGISLADVRSPSNYTFYPWTLPQSLIPSKGVSSPIRSPVISTLTFPNFIAKDGSEETKSLIPLGALQKVLDGVLINSLSNLRLNMVEQPKSLLLPNGDGVLVEMEVGREFRVHGIANWALGRDEKVLLSGEALQGVSPADPHFTRVKDLEMVDLVIDVPGKAADVNEVLGEWDVDLSGNGTFEGLWHDLESMVAGLLNVNTDQGQDGISPAKLTPVENTAEGSPSLTRRTLPAILPTGAGAAPLPASMDDDPTGLVSGQLPFQKVFFLDDTLCKHPLPASIAKSYGILVIKRGECSFNDKLVNIPSFPPSAESLQLVVMLSIPESKGAAETGPDKQPAELIRPLLDEVQLTQNGIERRYPIAMVMVDGSEEVVDMFKRLSTSIASFDSKGKLIELQKQLPHDLGIAVETGRPGLGVKRRYWFESMGVPIGNLIVL